MPCKINAFIPAAIESHFSSIVLLQGNGKKLKVVDIPGHPRLRSTFEARADTAAGVVFVLDSSTFIAEKHAVAGCASSLMHSPSHAHRHIIVLAMY